MTNPRLPGAESARDAETLLALGAEALHIDGDLRAGQQWFEAAYREGERLGDARIMAEATLGAVDNSLLAGHAVAAAAAGDHQAAMHSMASLLCPTLRDIPRSGTWLVVMYSFAEAANLIGSEAVGAKVYELLRPYRDQTMIASIGVACFGSVEHALGVAALAHGDLDRAVDHLDRAVLRNVALGHWPAARYSRLRLAEALERRRHPGDELAATAELDRAAELTAMLQASAGSGTQARPTPALATCTRQGRKWRVKLGGRVVCVQHSVGMLHLAVLLANPGAEIAAL
jgi:hypothetical protein